MAVKRDPLMEMIEVLAAEYADLVANGPRFTIICGDAPGRKPAAVLLVHRGRPYNLRLSEALLALFAYLSQQRFAQSISQIRERVAEDGYWSGRPSRAAVKMWLDRLRRRITETFVKAKLPVDCRSVLVCERTDSHVAVYSLRAVTTKWSRMPIK